MDQNNNYYDMDSINRKSGSNSVEKDYGFDIMMRRCFILGMTAGVAVFLLIFGIILIAGRLKATKPKGEVTGTVQAVKLKEDGLVTAEMIKKIEEITETIQEEFYLHEVTKEELADGIYKGLLQSLNDPYSEYYTPKEFEDLMSNSSGVYYGIGAYVSIDDATGYTKISGVIKNTPAEEVGLRANDILYMVDGVSTHGLSLTETVSLIKGEEFSQVMLIIVRDGQQLEIPVTRRKVESPTVNSEMYDNGMGYLQITEFDDVTSGQFEEAMQQLYAQGMKGLILDLRGNPGGNLSTVVKIAQNLLPEGIIVYTEDKAGTRNTYRSKGDKEIQIPMVVLIDMNSASASEILAGAIQDYEKGTLIGTTSFGKGIVQSVQPREDGSAIKITISSYYTPNGRNIHGKGIEPDIVCEFDGSLYYNVENPVDTQLEEAKSQLETMMQKEKSGK